MSKEKKKTAYKAYFLLFRKQIYRYIYFSDSPVMPCKREILLSQRTPHAHTPLSLSFPFEGEKSH